MRGLDLNAFDLVIAIENNAAVVVRELGIPEAKLQVWPIGIHGAEISLEYEDVALDIRRRLAKLKRAASLTGRTLDNV